MISPKSKVNHLNQKKNELMQQMQEYMDKYDKLKAMNTKLEKEKNEYIEKYQTSQREINKLTSKFK